MQGQRARPREVRLDADFTPQKGAGGKGMTFLAAATKAVSKDGKGKGKPVNETAQVLKKAINELSALAQEGEVPSSLENLKQQFVSEVERKLAGQPASAQLDLAQKAVEEAQSKLEKATRQLEDAQ